MRRAGDVCFSQVYRDRDGEKFISINFCFERLITYFG